MALTKSIKLVKGNMVGYLEQTLNEKWYGGKPKWVAVLAFVDQYGQWLYSGDWRVNDQKNACQELKKLGWIVVND